jgi:hypothetical protein
VRDAEADARREATARTQTGAAAERNDAAAKVADLTVARDIAGRAVSDTGAAVRAASDTAVAARGAVRGSGVGSGVGAGVGRGTGRGARVGAAFPPVVASPPPPVRALVDQGIMGTTQMLAALTAPGDTLIRTLDALHRLNACWEPIDSASVASVRGESPADTGGVFVLSLDRPVVTGGLGRERGGGGRAGRMAIPAAPQRDARPGARVQHTFPRQFSDTSFVTEWIVGSAHRQMYFTVRGDTLRGTTVKVYGDMVVADAPVVAVRVRCPQ